MPVGLEDTSKFPYLFAELIKRGWSDGDLKKLAGKNILRVLREGEGAAFRLRKLDLLLLPHSKTWMASRRSDGFFSRLSVPA